MSGPIRYNLKLFLEPVDGDPTAHLEISVEVNGSIIRTLLLKSVGVTVLLYSSPLTELLTSSLQDNAPNAAATGGILPLSPLASNRKERDLELEINPLQERVRTDGLDA